MSEPMTRKRMIEVLRVTAEDLGHRGRNTLLEWSIRNIEAVLAALEAEPLCACGGRKPIAVEKGHFYEDGGPGTCDLALENWVEIKPQDVEVLVFALPAEEEKA